MRPSLTSRTKSAQTMSSQLNKIPFDQAVSPDCCECMAIDAHEKTDLVRVDLDAKAREMKFEKISDILLNKL